MLKTAALGFFSAMSADQCRQLLELKDEETPPTNTHQRIADALGISIGAVYQWDEIIPESKAYRLERITADFRVYTRKRKKRLRIRLKANPRFYQ